MGWIHSLLDENRRFASTFEHGGLLPRAASGLALVTCMDSRILPLEALGLRRGDAKILRNAGGRVTPDVERSLAIAVAVLGVNRVVVMHHTDCALSGASEGELAMTIQKAGARSVDGWQFLTMPSDSDALERDVLAIRRSSIVPQQVEAVGCIYDVWTGSIEVKVS